MAVRGAALSPVVVRATDPRAVRKQAVGRGLIALVWAIGDVAQLAVGRDGGLGTRAGDGPFVGFAGSALIGAVLLCGLAVINLRAVHAVARRTRLLTRARLIGWLCGARLVAVVPVLFALRSLGDAADRIPQPTFMGLAMLALLDAVVALWIALSTAGALRRSTQPIPG